jgi:quercetin dioxygenase-like cupin family protein
MAHEKIVFKEINWKQGAHPLEMKKSGLLEGATLLRFEPGFTDPNWCGNGHAGYVLEGTLRLQFEDGIMDVGQGEGFIIDPGTSHRASNPADVPVVLFIAPRNK